MRWNLAVVMLLLAAFVQGAAIPDPRSPAQDLFVRKGCAACHQMKGVKEAKGAIGPDLTKLVASRSVDELGDFLAHPDQHGRGDHMASLDLTPRQVAMLVDLMLHPPRKATPSPSPRPTPRPSPTGM